MAITFVGSATGSVIDGGTCSIDLSTISGLAQNDIVVAFCLSSGGTVATPSTWSPVASENGVGSSNYQGGVFFKFMGASPDTSVSFWDSGTVSDSASAIALAFRNVDTGTPLDVAATEFEADDPIAVDAPAITPSSNNCCIIAFGSANAIDTSVGTITDYTSPTPGSTTSNDNNDTTVAAAYRILSGGSGVSQNPGTWSSWETFGDRAYAVTVALRPAAAATQGLEPSLYSDSDAFFTHTLTLFVSLNLYTDDDAFFTHALTSSYALAPTTYSDTDAFFTHTLAAGAVDLQPDTHADDDTFFMHEVAHVATTVTLRPDADIADGGWTNDQGGTELFSSISEEIVDDNDYIQSSEGPASDVCKISLGNTGTAVGEPITLRYRYRKQGTGQIDLTVRLLEGTTVLAEFVHTNIAATFADGEQNISPSPAIGDFDNLFLEFEANAP